jgi:hypothetical protein
MRVAPLPAALLLVAALAAPAAAQLRFMGWGDSTPNHQDLAFDCANPPAEATLVVSFVSPVSDLVGVRAVIDMCTKPDDLPEWWRFDLSEGCRAGTIGATTDFAAGPSTHAVAWEGPTSVTTEVHFGHTWSAAMNRFVVTIANGNLTPIPLVVGKEYYALKLTFRTPDGACPGCEMRACFVLNGLTPVTSTGEVETIMDYSNWTRWQDGKSGCPFIVPATAATWGRVKAAYR